MQPCVYMMTNQRNGTLYIGVTADLIKRVWQHKNEIADGFTKKYNLHTLIWYDHTKQLNLPLQGKKH